MKATNKILQCISFQKMSVSEAIFDRKNVISVQSAMIRNETSPGREASTILTQMLFEPFNSLG